MDNERNEHFKGFANLLWNELVEVNGYGYIDVNFQDDDGIDPTNYQLIIAQRAYDLMEHIMLYAPAAPVPDMTEWP